MARYRWPEVPAAVAAQVLGLCDALRAGLQPAGIYLHGSLAMGGFNPDRSDIDLLVVTAAAPPLATCRELLLRSSRQPCPIEISILSRADLTPWRFPTPYSYHFSEAWRPAGTGPGRDPDLAAHITVVRQRGVVIWGAPVDSVFPPVPAADYLAAIWEHDGQGAARNIAADPVNALLNLCRVLLFRRAGRVASKDEGGAWACEALPPPLQPLVHQALRIYRGEAAAPFDPEALQRFATYMVVQNAARVSRSH